MAREISYLFVPASRPDRYAKALGSDADEVIIDLEDAVAADEKDSALEALIEAFESGLERPAYVRINGAHSEWCSRDIAALSALSDSARTFLAGIILPEAESAADIERLADALGAVKIVALIESALGVANLRELARARGVTRLSMGAADLSFDLDVEISSSTIDYVYAQMVIESRLAGLPGPVASPPFSITDTDAVAHDAKRLRALGATGQFAIHPAQLAPIHEGFQPSPDAITWARKVIDAAGGASQVDGQMVDKPIQQRAARILSQAGE